jgi:hypothetical protein
MADTHPRFKPFYPIDASQFVVTRDFGNLGFESVSHPEWTRESIVRDIIELQIDRVASVSEFNPVEGWSKDITDDIREAVEARLAERVAA